jgi:site-specific recombinase XerD
VGSSAKGRHIVILNPARSVRGERHSVIEDKPPEMTPQQVAQLLEDVDTSHVVGLRDYSIILTLTYTAARVGAIARVNRGSLRDAAGDLSLQFSEKGGKQRLIPVRRVLTHYLRLYLDAADLWDALSPLPSFAALTCTGN